MERGRNVMSIEFGVVVHAIGRHDNVVVIAQSYPCTGRNPCYLHVVAVISLILLVTSTTQKVVMAALMSVARHHRYDRIKEYLEVRFGLTLDRKSTRLNSSHANISYAVFCLKKKKK